jgi:sirohydrochlorin cobaltochelatase
MLDPIEQALRAGVARRCCVGQISICRTAAGGFVLCHRDDELSEVAQNFYDPQDAAEIAKHDDTGNYRALKTAPNLRHGWRLEVVDLPMLRRALDHFYPGRLAMLNAWKRDRLITTPLRSTLDRQSGMYRIAAKISDEQINDLVADFCRSDGGCLRTILWRRDARGTVASAKLPAEKFDPSHDQTGHGESAIPLLCQEACPLLVSEARKVVKGE